jgi:hypothetical protein
MRSQTCMFPLFTHPMHAHRGIYIPNLLLATPEYHHVSELRDVQKSRRSTSSSWSSLVRAGWAALRRASRLRAAAPATGETGVVAPDHMVSLEHTLTWSEENEPVVAPDHMVSLEHTLTWSEENEPVVAPVLARGAAGATLPTGWAAWLAVPAFCAGMAAAG